MTRRNLLRGVWEIDRTEEGYIVLTAPNGVSLVMEDETAEMVGRMLLDEVENGEEGSVDDTYFIRGEVFDEAPEM